jgi:hypothetical protein
MNNFLYAVAALSYPAAGFTFLAAWAIPNPDMTFIISGVCAICGTVAAAGAAILSRLDLIADKMNDLRESDPR